MAQTRKPPRRSTTTTNANAAPDTTASPQRLSAAERRAARAAEAKRQQQRRRRNLLALAAGALVLLAIAGGFIASREQYKRSTLARVESFEGLSRNHPQGSVSYPQTPPVGGDHNPAWQNCGYYDAPVRNENAVHSLEHGAVWITYRPDLPADQVDKLRGLVDGQGYILVSPYPDLPSPVVASAWGKQLRLDSADTRALGVFIGEFRQGPQTPERGAACTGGVGTPRR